MRVMDITEQLTFEGNPRLVIKGRELEVNADAPSILKVMGLMDVEKPGKSEIMEAFEIIFPEKSRKEIDKLKLSFHDLMVTVEAAIGLVIGEDDQPGEQQPVL